MKIYCIKCGRRHAGQKCEFKPAVHSPALENTGEAPSSLEIENAELRASLKEADEMNAKLTRECERLRQSVLEVNAESEAVKAEIRTLQNGRQSWRTA